MERILYRLAVGGVCIHHDKLLFLRRRHDAEVFPSIWELPSGGVEPSEEPKEALVREVYEESGLNVRVGVFVGYFLYISKGNTPCIQVNHLCFLENCKPNQVILSEEHIEAEWVELHDTKNYNTSQNVQNIVQFAKAMITGGLHEFMLNINQS